MQVSIDHENLQEITLSGNSYGKAVCEYLADQFKLTTPKLTTINFNDIFVGRKLEELPSSLEALIRSLQDKDIKHLNLSDNAFGPTGINSFGFFLEKVATLETLRITNCGLGPVSNQTIIFHCY